MASKSKKSPKATKKKIVHAGAASAPSKRTTMAARTKAFLLRRPHRSFRRTRRRDYVRSLQLPGLIAFTSEVVRLLLRYKNTFGLLVLVYVAATIVLVGLASQSNYQMLAAALGDASQDVFSGGWGEVGKAGLLLLAGAQGSFSSDISEVQQVFVALIFVFVWLTTVWLLRAYMAGKAPRLRDGLYNAGAPFIGTTFLFLLFIVQLIPLGLAITSYTSAIATDAFSSGFLGLAVFIIAVLLALLSLYLVTSTFFALVIITLPGMYPWQALRASGDLVIGRRFRLLLRLLWLAICIIVFSALVMIPVIILTTWLQHTVPTIAWIPIVPFFLATVGSVNVIFASSYVYLLYRKTVDDDAAPA